MKQEFHCTAAQQQAHAISFNGAGVVEELYSRFCITLAVAQQLCLDLAAVRRACYCNARLPRKRRILRRLQSRRHVFHSIQLWVLTSLVFMENIAT